MAYYVRVFPETVYEGDGSREKAIEKAAALVLLGSHSVGIYEADSVEEVRYNHRSTLRVLHVYNAGELVEAEGVGFVRIINPVACGSVWAVNAFERAIADMQKPPEFYPGPECGRCGNPLHLCVCMS